MVKKTEENYSLMYNIHKKVLFMVQLRKKFIFISSIQKIIVKEIFLYYIVRKNVFSTFYSITGSGNLVMMSSSLTFSFWMTYGIQNLFHLLLYCVKKFTTKFLISITTSMIPTYSTLDLIFVE